MRWGMGRGDVIGRREEKGTAKWGEDGRRWEMSVVEVEDGREGIGVGWVGRRGASW